MKTKNKLKLSTAALLSAGALTLCAPSLSAAILAYEGFDYTPGTWADGVDTNETALAGQNGGTGWSAGWVDSSGTGNGAAVWGANPGVSQNGVLSWDGVYDGLTTSTPYAGTSELNGSANTDGSRVLSSSAGTLAGVDNILWMSVIMHVENQSAGAGISMGLGDAAIRGRGLSQYTGGAFMGSSGFTRGSSWATGANAIAATGEWSSNPNPSTNYDFADMGNNLAGEDDFLMVFKYTFGATDTVQTFAFGETVALSEATFDASTAIATMAIDESTMNTFSWTQSYGQNAIDDIRIGDSFLDVTTAIPEPSTTALLGLGGLALILRRRK